MTNREDAFQLLQTGLRRLEGRLPKLKLLADLSDLPAPLHDNLVEAIEDINQAVLAYRIAADLGACSLAALNRRDAEEADPLGVSKLIIELGGEPSYKAVRVITHFARNPERTFIVTELPAVLRMGLSSIYQGLKTGESLDLIEPGISVHGVQRGRRATTALKEFVKASNSDFNNNFSKNE
jgi:hypothetical protein